MGTLRDDPAISTGVQRVLDETFMLSTNGPSLVVYTIELEVTAPLGSAQFAQVALLTGSPEPVTQIDTAYLEASQLAGLGLLSIQTKARQTLTAWVQPNFVLSMVTSGTGDVTLVDQLEIVFGTPA